ncbi:MAG: type II toxin-antitoxin system VapC family toxin [Treponema sp.]|jgi:predicted nucleic acid-binding protein|nr:type II toxin-antitoxin system VapC family toxin [Treponema sp.]
MKVILDASAIMAVILNESNRDTVITLTENAVILSPEVISFEIGNALINLFRKRKITEEELLAAYRNYTTIPIESIKIDIEKALKIACKYKIYAYDAYYLEAAHRLKLPLITFDNSMKKAGLDLKIKMTEVET